jgi:superfamily II DNA or RNA helicase
MSQHSVLFRKSESTVPYALLRRSDDFGIEELDLLRAPGRFWCDGEPAPPGAEMHVDARRMRALPMPAELLDATPADNWMAMTRRSLARVIAWFLIAEDPQRRLEVQPIATLAHQASVVHHIAQEPSLKRVLLADEVGLGKTVEAGLLIQHVLGQKPGARILYLAPARLVRNVRQEFDRLGLQFRSWVATSDRDARLEDPRVLASIHRAAHEGRVDEVLAAPPWDMIVVDECHHLSDWAPGGGSPVAQYRLVEKLAERLGDDGRLLLMSGTPHQGHPYRFENVLRLLQCKGEAESLLAGRVIYRTKDDVSDWDGRPLFPRRQVNPELVVDLGKEYQAWLTRIHDFFEPNWHRSESRAARRRAAGWRAGQALQWAASSIQAGLGYLIRQAVRARQNPDSLQGLRQALAAVRPYRMGAVDEPIGSLWERITREVGQQIENDTVEDIEEYGDDGGWRPDLRELSALLDEGVQLLSTIGERKWEAVWDHILKHAGNEKVVLFAQPIETVTALAGFLEHRTGRKPALIIGNQSDSERTREVERFWEAQGPQFLVSSRAGGEGINLQIARRLVHLDVPWNPMEMEQRIGRVHRFMSRRTILVDTVVAKDSREVDTYAFARAKLRMIASTLVPEDRFEATFGRVMALIPPEELQDVMAQGPVGPLSNEDRHKLTELVTRGFEQWRTFHDRYSAQRSQISTLDPGEATWEDLASYAREHLGAIPLEDFSALRFLWQDGEVVEAPEKAHVLSIQGKPFACGDYGGIPVTRDDGTRAERLGTNVSLITRALRHHAFPEALTGAAHLRWPEPPAWKIPLPCGLLIAARQSVRWEQGTYHEHALSLHFLIVEPGGARTEVPTLEKGRLLRAIMYATIRREPEDQPDLRAVLRVAEAEFITGLRRPNDQNRDARHAVVPLLAAVIS